MFDTTKDLRRVIIDTQQREKLVNDYRYRRQLVGLICLILISVLGMWGIHIIEGVCYG